MDDNAQTEYKAQARILKALAHPTRLFIVDELSRGERCVCELTDLIGVEMPTVSRHLNVLKNAGLIEDEKRGPLVFYQLRQPCILKLCKGIAAAQSSSPGKVESFCVRPIGRIHSPFKRCTGTPVQPSLAQGAGGSIEVFDEFAAGLKDLAGFDRLWLLFWFHRAKPARMSVTPHLDSRARGLFATRAPSRPNPIGLSSVRLLKVEGAILRVADLDILDGTPLLDIKPCVPRFDYLQAPRCGWLDAITTSTCVADDRFERRQNEKG